MALTTGKNVAAYWGINSDSGEQSLGSYCNSNDFDIVILQGTYLWPVVGISLNGHCSGDGSRFSSGLAHCTEVAADITRCQQLGKKVILAMGHIFDDTAFSNNEEAEQRALDVWNMFGGGQADERPFDEVIVDGFDFELVGDLVGFLTFANKLQLLSDGDTGKKYYLSSTPPLCQYPPSRTGDILSHIPLDFVFIPYLNGDCSIKESFNWNTWQEFAKSAPNTDIQLFVGLPAGPNLSTYADLATVESQVDESVLSSCNFGGFLLWLLYWATNNVNAENVNFLQQISDYLDLYEGPHCPLPSSSFESTDTSTTTISSDLSLETISESTDTYSSTLSSSLVSEITSESIDSSITATSSSDTVCSSTGSAEIFSSSVSSLATVSESTDSSTTFISSSEGSQSSSATSITSWTTTNSASKSESEESDVVVVSASSLTTTSSESTSSGKLATPLPTASSLRNSAKLMGADLITHISLHANSTGSEYAIPHDFFTLNVTVESEKPITKGAKVQFGVPEVFYGNLNPFEVYSTEGEPVGTIYSDGGNVFTITFNGDYGLRHTNIKGSFTFNVKLRYIVHGKRDLINLDLSHEVVQPFVFTTVSRDFVSYIIFNDLTPGEDAGEVKPGDVFVFAGDSSVSLTTTSTSSTIASGLTTYTTTWTTTNTAGEAETDSGVVIVTTDSAGSLITTTSQFPTGSNLFKNNTFEGKRTETVTNNRSTLVTITSCSDHKCLETAVPATWGPVTTTLEGGVVTVYTTWCPEAGAQTEDKATTITITITSCSDKKCHKTTAPATWGPTTTTLEDGEVTVYTTWCPVTTSSVTVYETVVCAEDICKISTITGVLSPGQSTLETTGISITGTDTPVISTAFNGATKIGGPVLALMAIPLAYLL